MSRRIPAKAQNSQHCCWSAGTSATGACHGIKIKARAPRARHISPKRLGFKDRITRGLIACHPFLAGIFICATYSTHRAYKVLDKRRSVGTCVRAWGCVCFPLWHLFRYKCRPWPHWNRARPHGAIRVRMRHELFMATVRARVRPVNWFR